MTMIATRTATFIVAALIASVPDATSAPSGPPLPIDLASLIQSTTPGATVVQPEEIDSESCQPVPSSPSIVHGDLTGNHRNDFAILLKTKVTGKPEVWQGKTITQAQFALMLYSDDGYGSYGARRLNEFTASLPLAVYIALDPAGKKHDQPTGRDITTDHPTVSIVFCEKSELAYYIRGDEITEIGVSD